MHILGKDVQDLVRETGLCSGAVSRAVIGGNQDINIGTATLVARALELDAGDLEWPRPLTHRGRTPLTGTPIQYPAGSGASRITVNGSGGGVCTVHHMVMHGGFCSYCP